MARIKTVFNHSMLAHVWAQQNQPEGRASDGRMFFKDSKLWSYGSHFLIGKIMPDGVALLNADSYSISTSKHQSYARGAVSHRRVLYVPGLTSLELTGALDTGGKYDISKPERIKRIKKWLADLPAKKAAWFAKHEGGEDFKRHAGLYLLEFAGLNSRDSLKTWIRICNDAAKKLDRENTAKEKAARKVNLEYAATVAAIADMNDPIKAARDNLARRNDYELASDAKKLRHAHKAAKTAKRVKQSAAVWEVLKAVRIELKRRSDNARFIAANQERRQAVETLRGNLESIREAFNAGELVEPLEVRQAIHAAGIVMRSQSSRVFPKLIAIHGGLYDALPALEFEHTAKQERESARDLAAWKAGEHISRHTLPHARTYLRAVGVERDSAGAIIGGKLETSKGADVPLVHAVKAFRFLKLMRERNLKRVPGTGFGPVEYQNANCIVWRRNGHVLRVGHFQVDTVQADGGFTAGCHSIEWDQVEALARSLGVFDAPASDASLESSHAAA